MSWAAGERLSCVTAGQKHLPPDFGSNRALDPSNLSIDLTPADADRFKVLPDASKIVEDMRFADVGGTAQYVLDVSFDVGGVTKPARQEQHLSAE